MYHYPSTFTKTDRTDAVPVLDILNGLGAKDRG